MRINSSSISNINVNGTEATQTKPVNNNLSTTDNISVNQTQISGKDGRAAMRSAEMGIGARMVASQIQNGSSDSLADIKNNLSALMVSNKQIDLAKTPTEPKEKPVSEIFGNDAFKDNFSLDGKGSAKSKAAAKGGAASGAQAAQGSDSAQATGGAGGGGAMSLGALLALVGGILVKAIEKTMKNLEGAAKQLDAAVASGGGGGGSSPSGAGATGGAGGAGGADNPTNTNGAPDANGVGASPGTTPGAGQTNGVDGSPLNPLLEKLSTILSSMKDLAQQLSSAIKQFDLSNPANQSLENNKGLSDLINKMKDLQQMATQLGADGPKMMQDTLAKASVKLDNLDNLAGASNLQNAPQANGEANASAAGDAAPAASGADAQAPQGSAAPSSGGGGGGTAALNQKIQELTFTLQQIQQSLNRVNETVTNLSRSQSDAAKSVVQNLSV